MRRTAHRSLVAVLALGGVLFHASHAEASGFAVARFGAEHGHPTTTNPTAVYYNPAAMTASEGFNIFADGNFALRSVGYTRGTSADDAPVPPGAEGANTGAASLFNFAAAPMLGATGKFGDFALGLGFYVPFGGGSRWGKNEAFLDHPQYPGPVDGVQRWSGIEGTMQSTYFTLAAAYKIPSTPLSVGVSGNLIRSQVNTLRAREPSGTNDIDAEGRSHLDVSGMQGSFGVGVMLEAVEKKLWFGASYQSRPNVSGGMKLSGTLRNNFGGITTEDAVELHQDLPDIIRLGLRARPSSTLEFRLFGDLSRWSSFERQCLSREGQECVVDPVTGAAAGGSDPVQNIERRWNDAFGVRGGMSLWVLPEVEVMTGLGFDSNAVPDETIDPILSGFNSVSAALGGRFRLMEKLHLAATYTHLFYFSRDITDADNISSRLDQRSRSPNSNGRYSQAVGVLNLNLNVAF